MMTDGNDRALLSMTRFRCIGSECEDHCCGGWAIGMDRSTHDALHRAYESLTDETPPFSERVTLVTNNAGVSKGNFATMNHSPDGNCTFLRPDGWCDIHARFGGELLPTVCASYPRRFAPAQGGLEIGGSLSCPEVARLTLLTDDGADVVTFDGGPGLRAMQWTESPSPDGPYTTVEWEVQGALTALLSYDRYDLGARLFCLAWLGQTTSVWFHRGSSPDAVETMRATLRGLLVQSTLDELVERYRELPSSPALPLKLVTEVLVKRAATQEDKLTAGFTELVIRVFSRYLWPGVQDTPALSLDDLVRHLATQSQPSVDQSGTNGAATNALEQIIRAYGGRQSAMPPELTARIDAILARYCRTFVFSTPYRKAQDLAHHLVDMLVRAVVIRFLVVGHPRLDPPGPQAIGSRGPSTADVDEVAVEVIYRLSRVTEHFPGFLGWFRQYLEGEGALGLAHQALLASFHTVGAGTTAASS